MDISNAFVTALLDTGSINAIQREGITEEFLADDSRRVFRYTLDYYREYKSVPSRDAVTRAFPSYKFGETLDGLDYYIAELKDTFKRRVLEEKLDAVAQIYLKDTVKAESLLRDTLASLQIAGTAIQDVDFVASATDRISVYDHRKAHPGANGILSKWSTLDYQTLGWQPEEFVVFVGEKYVGKSWGMLWMALQAALQRQRVLFITKEMSQEAILRRLDALYARVCFDSLRRGELTAAEESRYKKSMETLSERKDFHFRVARNGVNTIDDIEAKASEVNADIIFGDSIYLFDPDTKQAWGGGGREVQRRMAVSQRCKLVATRLGIPFVVSVQAGRNKKGRDGAPSIDDIEWSNAFSQDGDTVFFVQKQELDRELHRAEMFLVKSRDGDLAQWFINQDFATMNFSERDDEVSPTTDVFNDADEETLNYGQE